MADADYFVEMISLVDRLGPVTAQGLADDLGISVDQVEQSIRGLRADGVPIEGSAQAGYRLAEITLPSLSLTLSQLEVLAFSLHAVAESMETPSSETAASVLEQIASSLPPSLREVVGVDGADDLDDAMAIPGWEPMPPVSPETLEQLQVAVAAHEKVRISYRDLSDALSERVIWPLELVPAGYAWTLGAWCELRADYRSFLPESIQRLEVLDEQFDLRAGVSLEEYHRSRNAAPE